MKTIDDYKQYFDPDEHELKGWVTNHIFVAFNGQRLDVEVDDYMSADAETFDEEVWRSRQGVISTRLKPGLGRQAWAVAYRIARGLVKYGAVSLTGIDGEVVARAELPCKISFEVG